MKKIVYFFQSEPAAGIVLMVAAAAGIYWANSSWAEVYLSTLNQNVLGMSVLHWINDGLMAIFFLFVGLEVKRELLAGELDSNAKRLLPGLAAIGGLLVPALIYLALNGWTAPTAVGWAIPTATDIAFALGVLALFGSRVPVSLKIFLTALAIMDDLAAIVIIALFYTSTLNVVYLVAAMVVLGLLYGLNKKGVRQAWPYVILGGLLWWLILKSGVHATLAGVALAFTIPLRVAVSAEQETPLIAWEHVLSSWVAFGVVPVFGWANAGVSFAGFHYDVLFEPVVIGIATGLFLGKQLGVVGTVWLLVQSKITRLPEGATWWQLYGVALLCGIGFTMSLFIALLAFADPVWQEQAKIGVLFGSALSGLAGFIVLFLATGKRA
ncbi:MAG: Na+/H+ antiporter NhaA [Neisseria sp.]|nr:Na+/H+ antiporter NhaA [Neisseria sp.]